MTMKTGETKFILFISIYEVFLSFGTLKNKLPPLDGHKRDYKIKKLKFLFLILSMLREDIRKRRTKI